MAAVLVANIFFTINFLKMKSEILAAISAVSETLTVIKDNTREVADDIDYIKQRLEDALNDDGLTRDDAQEVLDFLAQLATKATSAADLTREVADKVEVPPPPGEEEPTDPEDPTDPEE